MNHEMRERLQNKRLRLIRCTDPYVELKPGEEGTISHVDDTDTVHVRWDNGLHLGLVPEEDDFELIG